jgi:hypothetical protein
MKMKLIIVLIALLTIAAARFCDERINFIDIIKSKTLFAGQYKYQKAFDKTQVNALFTKNGSVSLVRLGFGDVDTKGHIVFYEEAGGLSQQKPTLFYSSNIVCDTEHNCFLEYISLEDQTLFSRQVYFKYKWVSKGEVEPTKLEECEQNLKNYFNIADNLICRIDNLESEYQVFSIRLSEGEYFNFDTKPNEDWKGINISFQENSAVLKQDGKKIIQFDKFNPCYFMLEKIYEIVKINSLEEYNSKGDYLYYFKVFGENIGKVQNTGKLKVNSLFEIEVESKVEKFIRLTHSILPLPRYEGYNFQLQFTMSSGVFTEFWVKFPSKISILRLKNDISHYQLCLPEQNRIFYHGKNDLQADNDIGKCGNGYLEFNAEKGYIEEYHSTYHKAILKIKVYEMIYLVEVGKEWILIRGAHGDNIINKKYLVTLRKFQECIDLYKKIEGEVKKNFSNNNGLYYYQLEVKGRKVISAGQVEYLPPNKFRFNNIYVLDKKVVKPAETEVFLSVEKMENSLTLYGEDKALKLYFGCRECLNTFVEDFKVQQSKNLGVILFQNKRRQLKKS